MKGCIAYCERKIKEASEAGNYTDFQNYTHLLNEWKARSGCETVKE